MLTGWGYDEPTQQYFWILRNTYGDHWGESGYARLAFGQDANNFGYGLADFARHVTDTHFERSYLDLNGILDTLSNIYQALTLGRARCTRRGTFRWWAT